MALKEICISLLTRANVEEGEIIDVRDPIGGIGRLEGNEFLWILADDRQFGPRGGPRQVINLVALAAREPGLDLVSARDHRVYHQPFLPISQKTGLYTDGKATSLVGLVRDKI